MKKVKMGVAEMVTAYALKCHLLQISYEDKFSKRRLQKYSKLPFSQLLEARKKSLVHLNVAHLSWKKNGSDGMSKRADTN